MAAPTAGLTASSVLELHLQLLQNNQTNTENTLALVQIIGGIDKILNNYLTLAKNDQSILTKFQLIQIQNIIINNNDMTHTNSLSRNKLSLRSQYQYTSNKLEISEDLTYHFSRNNTYLHSIFGTINGSKIVNLLYSKRFLYIFFILVNFSWTQFFVEQLHYFYITIPAFVFWIVAIPWILLLILSSNKKAFKMISTSFEFWFKISYVIGFVIANMLYTHYIKKTETDRQNTIWFVYDCVYSVVRILTITLWSLLDALQFPLYVKMYLGLIVSISYTIQSVFLTIYATKSDEEGKDDSIMFITNSISISLLAFMQSALRVVSIFLLKQTVLSIVYRNQCVLIKYSPHIKWVNTENDNQNAITDNIINNVINLDKYNINRNTDDHEVDDDGTYILPTMNEKVSNKDAKHNMNVSIELAETKITERNNNSKNQECSVSIGSSEEKP